MTLSRPLRTFLRFFLPCLLIPSVAVGGALLFPAQRSLWTALAIALLTLALFYLGIEEKRVGTRRMVVVTVMTAFCVAGRWIPLFSPMTALTILTALYLGAEAGFLCGSMAMLLSNFAFGQGPWTPFQMVAMGLLGFVAGLISRLLLRQKALLLLFGALAGWLYSCMMDVFTVLWYQEGFSMSLFWAAQVTALPHTVLYALGNLLFLWFFSRPFGEKLGRIRYKYGI